MEEALFRSKNIERSSITSELHSLSSVSSDDCNTPKNLESIPFSDLKSGGSPAASEASDDEEPSSAQQLSVGYDCNTPKSLQSTAFSDLKIGGSPAAAEASVDEESSSAQQLSVGDYSNCLGKLEGTALSDLKSGRSPAASEVSVDHESLSAQQLKEAAFESEAAEGLHDRKLEIVPEPILSPASSQTDTEIINESSASVSSGSDGQGHTSKTSAALFTLGKSLPDDIFAHIVSKLPIEAMVKWKCLSRQWMEFLESTKHKFHAPTWLVVMTVYFGESSCKMFDDELAPVAKSYFSRMALPVGSAGGLLLGKNMEEGSNSLFLWNPILPSYLEIVPPKKAERERVSYGFGWSKACGYKIVRLSHLTWDGDNRETETICHVYSLPYANWNIVDTGVINEDGPFYCIGHATFFKENLYWAVSVYHSSMACICCYDITTDSFSSKFGAPPYENVSRGNIMSHGFDDSLGAIDDKLCFSDCSSEEKINLWLLNDQKTWEKKYVIQKSTLGDDIWFLKVVRVLEDGNLLIFRESYLDGGRQCWELVLCRRNNQTHEIIDRYTSASSTIFHVPTIVPMDKIGGIGGAGILGALNSPTIPPV